MTDTTELRKAADLVERLNTIARECANGRPINGGDIEEIEEGAEALVSLQRENAELRFFAALAMGALENERAAGNRRDEKIGLLNHVADHQEAELSRLRSEVEGATSILRRLEPFLDAIICYASSIDEHEPNRIAKDARDFLNGLGGEG